MNDKTELRSSIKAAVVKSLTERMAANELTVTMLSEFAGLCDDGVSRIMHCHHAPNVLTLCMIAKVLRCSLDDLVPPEAYR